MSIRRTILLSFLVVGVCRMAAQAETKVSSLFCDHMVLQRGVPGAAIWGTAAPGQAVVVEFASQKKQAVADTSGKWLVKLDALKANAEPAELHVGDQVIRDVLVGDVWLCGGQSNMERQLGPRPPQPLIENWEQEVASANFPRIRHFGVAHKAFKEPVQNVTGTWVVCSPQTVKDFTAVGYFFGRELHQKLKVPIGLIHSSWGGTGVATWTSKESLDTLPQVQPEVAAALSRPKVGSGTPSILYQSMIAPLIPYGIKGAIWFQGESGPGLKVPYDQIFKLMIADWRRHWGIGDFPFYFVQLPNGSPETREAQAQALELPNTGMAICIDVGDKDVHGPKKAPIGQRLAKLALGLTYGKEGEYTGPMFESAAVDGHAIRVRFNHISAGLICADGQPLRNFTIAGKDGKFLPAEAKIEVRGKDDVGVVVGSEQVANPVSVRYAWSNVVPNCNLFNTAGLPAAPFRTDAGLKK